MQLSVRDSKYQDVVKEVLQKHLSPEDQYEIAAILEANGWNDARAAKEFGVEDIFELAGEIWRISQQNISARAFADGPRKSIPAYLYMIIRSFLRGTIFALPMTISVLAMLTMNFSISSYIGLTLEVATSIAIGTIMSFMAVGGFAQAIARRGFLYINLGNYNLARRVVFYLVRVGYAVCITAALLFIIFNLFFSIFPYRMLFVIIIFFFFLSAIWLSFTIFYVLGKEIIIPLLLVIGIAFVFVLFRLFGIDVIIAQLISLGIVSVCGAWVALGYFKKMEKKSGKALNVSAMPRTAITIYTVLPYFVYGFLYFSFLYTDRIIAWSTDTQFMPYIIWFRGAYELGLDYALFALIIPMGLIEVVISELMGNIEKNQKNFSMHEIGLMNRMSLRSYFLRMIIVAVFSLISSVAVYYSVKHVHLLAFFPVHDPLISSNTTNFVFIIGLIGFTILCIGLMNALVLFCFSQPENATRAMLWAILSDIVLGFLLSRWFDHTYAVFGFVLGAIVFTVMTSKAAFRLLEHLDYYLYSNA